MEKNDPITSMCDNLKAGNSVAITAPGAISVSLTYDSDDHVITVYTINPDMTEDPLCILPCITDIDIVLAVVAVNAMVARSTFE